MAKYIPVIGMEIHAELKTKSKMFCTCPNGYELQKEPNKNVCPVCMAHPGTLPTINEQAVEWTILVGLALDCQIAKKTKFDRKNYFYPDLPKGYQISQYDQPLTSGGNINIDGKDIGITRIHLEEDTGKLAHGQNSSLIDLSRAGTPLIELVTDPVIKSAKEAKDFCQVYQQILRYLEISEADMEKGQMRCEANISMQEAGKFAIEGSEVKPLLDYKLSAKVELKNINSFRAMERAVEYEIKRQTKILENNEPLVQETRGWDEDKQKTFSQRIKETAADYRYFPEPDLPPLEISDDLIVKLKASLPELPHKKLKRFIAQFNFKPEDAKILISDKDLADYAEQVVSELIGWLISLPETEGTEEEIWAKEGKKLSKIISNWLISRLFKHLNDEKVPIKNSKITPENFAELITLIYHNRINNLAAQKVLEEMFKTGDSPTGIMEKNDLGQVDDKADLQKTIEIVVNNNQKVVADYKAGKEVALKFLMGQVMKETKGKANPQTIQDLLKKKLA
ncbi:MAG: Asp-tRNA(Asn)/Glu-tRNA(Gln) amidotransferase subunit GatB [Candidatus Buchananbacteria bacterium]|nr:Asp-tRNA(Asn)/Glu-tRNA(Gln) amidotransferase subunit GatB [Candidatus Buchananbacteria bacterium]